jgi:hypothetical protein
MNSLGDPETVLGTAIEHLEDEQIQGALEKFDLCHE